MLEAGQESGAPGRRLVVWLDAICRRGADSPESLWRRRVLLGFSLTQTLLLAALVALAGDAVDVAAIAVVMFWHGAALRAWWRGVAAERCALGALIGMALCCVAAWRSDGEVPLGGLLALVLCAFCLLGRRGAYPWLALPAVGAALAVAADSPEALLRLSPFDGLALLCALFTVALYAHCGGLYAQDFRPAEPVASLSPLDDTVTGLFNRRGLGKHWLDALEHARRNGTLVGTITFRLDRWPQRELSKEAPLILLELAGRIRACLRQTDFAAYLGQGEFVLILCNLKGRRGLEPVIQRARLALAEPVALAGGPVALQAEMGTAIFPFDAESAEDLLDVARHDGERAGGREPAPLLDIVD